MAGFLARFRLLGLMLAILGFALSAPCTARAEGTVRIQHADGSVDSYPHSKIRIIHNTLNISTADGKGTLVVYRAACSYQSEVMVCLPTGLTLIQSGEVEPLDLLTGTVYLNMTDSAQQLMYSTTQLPPKSILLAFKTKRGTYATMSGTIDKVTK
ncbi:MAG: hypothetical protein WB615_06685 [Candidatus Tumulicola sp.]